MSEPTSRLVPDSECKQGKCGCTTTGCYGKCALEMVPSITMEVCTVPYAELQAELAATKQKLEEMAGKRDVCARTFDKMKAHAKTLEDSLRETTKRLEALEAERKELEKQEPITGWYSYDAFGKLIRVDPRACDDAFRLFTRPLPAPDLQKLVDELEDSCRCHNQTIENLHLSITVKDEENAELTKKLAWYESPHDEGLFNAIKEQASHRDSLAACTIYIGHLERRVKELTTIISAARAEGIEEGRKMASVWVVENRTHRVYFATQTDATAYVSQFPATVSGGLTISEAPVVSYLHKPKEE